MKTGLESLDTGASKITYSGNEGPKSPQQMAMADPLLIEEYQNYVFDMEEQGLQPMSFEEFRLQAMSGMAEGGVAQLVKKNEDGSRPGYRGLGGYGGGPGGGAAAGGGLGEGPSSSGGSGDGGDRGDAREQYSVAQTQGISPTTQSELGIDKSAVGQFSEYGKNVMNKNLDSLRDPLGFSDAARVNLLSPKSIFSGLTSLITGIPFGVLANLKGTTPTDDEDDDDRGNGENNLPIVNMANIAGPTTPIVDMTTTTTPTTTTEDETEDETKDFVNRFTQTTSLPFQNYRGGIEVASTDGGKRGYAGGGIADLRQAYGLGSIVKKATRAVKKIVKSPIGKAALAYALTGGLGNLAAGKSFGANFFSPSSFINKGNLAKIFSRQGLKNIALGVPGHIQRDPTSGIFGTGGAFSPFRSIALASALPFVASGTGQEEDEEKIDYENLSNIFDTIGSPSELRRMVLAGGVDRAQYPFLPETAYLADGGRIGLMDGGDLRTAALNQLYGINDDEEDKKLAFGGSAGLPPITAGIEGQASQSFSDDETPTPTQPDQMPRPRPMMNPMMARQMNPMMASRMNPMMSMQPRMMAQEGGLMDMGGMEKDYRNEGGFVPIGGQERADDVPARLSKNEFVFTADAVRNAGGGDIDKGAEIMENMMENLEAGGKVSKASQGLKGAREMFAIQQRLGEVL